jgi:hypothetical protein
MRFAARVGLTVLSVGLICGLIGAVSENRVDAPAGSSAFQKSLPAPLAIESASSGVATSSVAQWIGVPAMCSTITACMGSRVAVPRSIRAIALIMETALNQRPPPRNLLS